MTANGATANGGANANAAARTANAANAIAAACSKCKRRDGAANANGGDGNK